MVLRMVIYELICGLSKLMYAVKYKIFRLVVIYIAV